MVLVVRPLGVARLLVVPVVVVPVVELGDEPDGRRRHLLAPAPLQVRGPPGRRSRRREGHDPDQRVHGSSSRGAPFALIALAAA